MHIMHLAVVPDVLGSLLCDLSDGNPSQRESELQALWDSYHSWCEDAGSIWATVWRFNRIRLVAFEGLGLGLRALLGCIYLYRVVP